MKYFLCALSSVVILLVSMPGFPAEVYRLENPRFIHEPKIKIIPDGSGVIFHFVKALFPNTNLAQLKNESQKMGKPGEYIMFHDRTLGPFIFIKNISYSDDGSILSFYHYTSNREEQFVFSKGGPLAGPAGIAPDKTEQSGRDYFYSLRKKRYTIPKELRRYSIDNESGDNSSKTNVRIVPAEGTSALESCYNKVCIPPLNAVHLAEYYCCFQWFTTTWHQRRPKRARKMTSFYFHFNGKKYGGYDEIHSITVSDNQKGIAFRCQNTDDRGEYLWHNGTTYGPFGRINTVRLSKSGKHVAFFGWNWDKDKNIRGFIQHNGRAFPSSPRGPSRFGMTDEGSKFCFIDDLNKNSITINGEERKGVHAPEFFVRENSIFVAYMKDDAVFLEKY